MSQLDPEIPLNSVTLRVNDTYLTCSRQKLAQCSPYFNAMFNSGMVESRQNIIELKDACPHSMQVIIEFVKTGKIDCPIESIPRLLQIASMFQFDVICEHCIQTMLSTLNTSNCLEYMFLSGLLGVEEIQRKAKELALWHFDLVSQGWEFMRTRPELVVEYLSQDGLRAQSEELVLRSVLAYLEHNFEKRGLEHYEELFTVVRFSEIDRKCLKAVAHDPFVRSHQQLRRLIHEIWEIKLLSHCHSNGSSSSVTPLSDDSPAEGRNDPEDGVGGHIWNDYIREALESLNSEASVPHPLSFATELKVEQVIARRALSSGPRVIPMVPAIVLYNKAYARLPSLVYYDEHKSKLVKLDVLKKPVQHSSGIVNVASGFKACVVENDVYIIGGEFILGNGNWNKSMWKFNTMQNVWYFLANLAHPRRHHLMCTMDDSIYLLGGIGRFRVAQTLMQRLDIHTGTVVELSSLPIPATSAAVTMYRGQMYVFESCIYRYSPEANSWTILKSVGLPPLGFHTALPHANGIYLIGRCNNSLNIYIPESPSQTGVNKACVLKVGDFANPTENACIVGNKIYSFSNTEYMTVESYDIEIGVFTVEYQCMDGEFANADYQYGCFALPRYS